MSIVIREALASDIPCLCRLEEQCFSSPWTAKGFEEFFENGCSRILVAELDGAVCGYVGMNLIMGDGEITNIAVDGNFRRKGVAAALLEGLMKTRGLERLMLDVRVSNTAARGLYEKFGFTVDGVRKGFYIKPKEDAVLMSRNMTK